MCHYLIFHSLRRNMVLASHTARTKQKRARVCYTRTREVTEEITMRHFYAIIALSSSLAACSVITDITDHSEQQELNEGGGGSGGDGVGGGEPDGGTPCIVDDACGKCVVSTRFPAVGLGDAVIICSECDRDTCVDSGTPCESYGASCTVGDSEGVCTTCCAGLIGKLQCVKL